MKNAFYFTLKTLFVLKIFKFLSRLFSLVEKCRDLKVTDNSKIYDVTTRAQTIVIHVFPNNSRSEGNQIIKFGQLIEYDTTNILLGKSYTKCGGETILRYFSKRSKLSIYIWINSLKFYTVCFYCMPN